MSHGVNSELMTIKYTLIVDTHMIGGVLNHSKLRQFTILKMSKKGSNLLCRSHLICKLDGNRQRCNNKSYQIESQRWKYDENYENETVYHLIIKMNSYVYVFLFIWTVKCENTRISIGHLTIQFTAIRGHTQRHSNLSMQCMGLFRSLFLL